MFYVITGYGKQVINLYITQNRINIYNILILLTSILFSSVQYQNAYQQEGNGICHSDSMGTKCCNVNITSGNCDNCGTPCSDTKYPCCLGCFNPISTTTTTTTTTITTTTTTTKPDNSVIFPTVPPTPPPPLLPACFPSLSKVALAEGK